MRIYVQRRVPPRGVPAPASLRRWAARALGTYQNRSLRKRGPGGQAGDLTIRIVNEAESARLNFRYRRKRGATNVLSFSYGIAGIVGDLVICAPVVAREAAAQGKRLRAHWAHVVVHGVLHLLGYDHEKPRAAGRMEGRERAILASLSFPDPYEPPYK